VIKIIRFILLPLAVLFLVAASLFAAEKQDTRLRTYIEPTRIVWQSADDAKASVSNATELLKPKLGQVSEGAFLSWGGCMMENKGAAPAILLDFGRELHGGIAIAQGHARGAKVRVRFGESVGEAMAEAGEKGVQKDHSARDDVHELPWLGTTEMGQTGFRFVRIDLVSPGTVWIESVRAVSLMRPMAQLGAFRCSDERLNRIWETAARTVHLCAQDYLWDGIKRDRLVWMGDMHPEICALLAAFSAAPVIPESLDYILATTSAKDDQAANRMGTYSYWLVRGLHDWWYFTGDDAFLAKRKAAIVDTLEFLLRSEKTDGRGDLGGLLDWPTHHNEAAERDGAQALRVWALKDGVALAEAMGETALAEKCRAAVQRGMKVAVDPRGENSAAAVMALSGMKDPRQMYDEVLGKNGIAKFSTFYGYYMLEAMSAAGKDAEALKICRDYWGGMLDMGATSFWEDFNLAWTNGVTRLDEMPQPGRKDIHGDFGDYCYVGYRHSLCHGWSAGPAAWLSRHVLGVEPLTPGGKVVRIRPHLGNLAWAEGAVPLASGVLKLRHEKRSDGSIATTVLSRPDGVRLLVQTGRN